VYLDVLTASQKLGPEFTANSLRRLIRKGDIIARKSSNEFEIHKADLARFKYFRDLIIPSITEPDIVWVMEACRCLAEEVKRSSFKPTKILAIAEGGIIPGAFINLYLGTYLETIKIVHYNGREKLPAVHIIGDLSRSDVPTLIVDDISDSGETLSYLKNRLQEKGVSDVNIKVATLHVKPQSSFKPDWFISTVTEWIRYPWEDK